MRIPGKEKAQRILDEKIVTPMRNLWAVALTALSLACLALFIAIAR